MSRGRPKLKEESRKRFFGITISPDAAERLEKIEGNRSHFISEILTKIPTSWIKKYNKSPHQFEPFG